MREDPNCFICGNGLLLESEEDVVDADEKEFLCQTYQCEDEQCGSTFVVYIPNQGLNVDRRNSPR